MLAKVRFCFFLIVLVLMGFLANNHMLWANSQTQNFEWEIHSQIPGHKIAMVSTNDGWIVQFEGQAANLYRWDGNVWANAGTLTHTQFIVRGDIFMVSATDGWIVLGGPLSGSSNLAESAIYRWDGNTWTFFGSVTDPNAVSFSALDFVSAADGWATAAFNFGSHFYRWNGSAWQKETSVWLPLDAGNDIDMVSATDGWAVGFQGNIFRWDGNTWTEVDSPVTTSLNSIDMVSATNGWAVGANGVILKWNGNTWSQAPSPTTVRLNAINMVSDTEGWIVGGGWNGQNSDPGLILHWDGNAWSEVTIANMAQLNDVVKVQETDGWIVGNNNILRYVEYAPTLTMNFASGAPGSFFTVTGTGFPENNTAVISANGQELGSVSSDVDGAFMFLLSTADADEGLYFVTASVNPSATVSFTLDSDEPLRPQEGDGSIFNIPAGIAFTESIFLPIILRE
jgi:hypothetical protein